MGLPHAIYISTANITDRNGALEAFALKTATLTAVSNVIVDSAYSGENESKSSTRIGKGNSYRGQTLRMS